jgi:starvation-inducible DNA-binding protein
MEFFEDARVYTARDQDLGKIDRIVIDPVAGEVTHLVVRKGIFLPEDKVVPIADIATATAERINLRDEADPSEYRPFEERMYVPLNTDTTDDAPGNVSPAPVIPPVAWYGPYGAPIPQELPYTRTVTERNIPERAVALAPDARVLANDDSEIGTVEHVITDDAGRTTHLVVGYDIPAPARAIPITFVERITDGSVRLAVDPMTIGALPPFNRDSDRVDLHRENTASENGSQSTGSHRLQMVLIDLVDLTLQIQHVRWNLDDTAEGLREQLDDFDALVRAGSDAVAARLRALGIAPDGRIDTLRRNLVYPPIGAGPYDTGAAIRSFTSRLARLAARIREATETAIETEPGSAEVLDSLSEELHTWTTHFDITV